MTGIAGPQHSWDSLVDPKPLTQTACKLQVTHTLCVLEIIFTIENVIQCKHYVSTYTIDVVSVPC